MDDHTFRTRLEAIMGMSHNDQQHQLDALNLERQHQCQIIAKPRANSKQLNSSAPICRGVAMI
jgi:hypothetical protein